MSNWLIFIWAGWTMEGGGTLPGHTTWDLEFVPKLVLSYSLNMKEWIKWVILHSLKIEWKSLQKNEILL